MVESRRVDLPAGVRSPFEVYLNGVRQRPGEDFEVRAGQLVFRRPLVHEGGLSLWRWFLGAWGIGTYKRNDEVDVRYEVEGEPRVAHKLPLVPER
jgi:hypothetical protein